MRTEESFEVAEHQVTAMWTVLEKFEGGTLEHCTVLYNSFQ